MRRLLGQSVVGFTCFAVLMTAATAKAHEPIAEMTVSADRFLDALDEGQRKKAVYEMTDEQRQNWHFVPDKFIKPDGVRYGLPIEQMSPEQRVLAYSLVNAALSHNGYLTAMTIMSLEQVLHELEQKNPIRKPELYYVTIFGKPGDEQAWGWRVEGHHLSVNVTIVDGKLISVTPSFFGANPAVVKEGPRKGLWTLREEEQLARNLVKSLSDEQREAAILSYEAPADIITKEDRKVDKGVFLPPKGIAFKNLDNEQQAALLRLVKVFAEKYRPEIIKQVDDRSNLFDLNDAYFAWAGGREQGQGHYYRVQTPKFLFEYDNTQNNANHVHAVWRDFDGDFGADLLRKHYDDHHAEK